MAKAGAKKKAANGYKLAEILPAGEILEDVRQKKWRLGISVGQGGFGRIYSAQDATSTGSSYPYVIKIVIIHYIFSENYDLAFIFRSPIPMDHCM